MSWACTAVITPVAVSQPAFRQQGIDIALLSMARQSWSWSTVLPLFVSAWLNRDMFSMLWSQRTSPYHRICKDEASQQLVSFLAAHQTSRRPVCSPC